MNHDALYRMYFQLFGQPENQPAPFFAPGRVNLIGEHTDYNGGFVLPCALQFGINLIIRRIEGPLIRLASTNFDFRAEIPVADISNRVEKQWVNYPLGIFDQFKQRNIRIPGMELLYSGTIPNSAGLSSSASIEMVTAFALNAILKTEISLLELIRLSQKAENQFVGVNCGIMDQFAVGMGEKDHAIFLNCRTLENKMVPLILDGISLVIANTNKQRGLTDSKYNERVAECQLAVSYLSRLFDISQLGEISFMQFYKIQDQIPDEVIRRRARHVLSENQRVLNSVSCLWNHDILQFGALMNASHESLKENYEVTGIELDTLVEEAQKINGVLGARMTGAGFGGCTVNLVKNETVDHFMDQVGRNYHLKTGLKADFYLAEVSDGVRKVS
ncbi:MAG: galactokinase [bacterium]